MEINDIVCDPSTQSKHVKIYFEKLSSELDYILLLTNKY